MTFLDPFLENRGGSYSLPDGGAQADNMPSSTVFYLDATDSDSVASTAATSFENVETAPADSEAQAAYDVTMGDIYEIQGTIGKSDAYLSKVNIGFYHELEPQSTWLKSLSGAGSKFYFGVAFRKSAAAFLTNDKFFTTNRALAATVIGVALTATSDTNLRFHIANGTGTYAVEEDFTVSFVDGDYYALFITYDEATGKLDLYLNGAKQSKTGVTLGSPALTTYTKARLNYGGGNDGLPLGTRTVAYIMGNDLLSSSDEATIRTAWQAAHNRSYTALYILIKER